jgi:hypothetical protein
VIASVLGGLLTLGIVTVGEGEDEIAECQREEDVNARFRALPSEMEPEQIDVTEQAELNEAFAEWAGGPDAKVAGRRIAIDGNVVGVGLVLPVGESDQNREDFKEGLLDYSDTGAAPPAEVQLGSAGTGFEGSFGPEGTAGRIVVGFAGCHAVAGIADDGQTARQIAEALATN